VSEEERRRYEPAGWDGDWIVPVVCFHESEPPTLICHLFTHERGGLYYTAGSPDSPRNVRQTRTREAIGVPGNSRESVRPTCPTCGRSPLVSRKRWDRIISDTRERRLTVLPLSTLD
jgi:hypothetical protein